MAVLFLYQVVWNLPYRWLFEGVAARLPDTDPATIHEYVSLTLSGGIKALVALSVILVIRLSRTPRQAIGAQVPIQGRPWVSWLLPLMWAGLLLLAFHAVATLSAPQASSRPGAPPLTRPLMLWTILFRQLVNPLSEELIFRVLVYLTLRRKLRVGYALLLSSLLFGIIHYNGGMHQQVLAFLMGLGMTWVYERSQSLPQVYFLHSSLNLARMLLGLSQGHL